MGSKAYSLDLAHNLGEVGRQWDNPLPKSETVCGQRESECRMTATDRAWENQIVNWSQTRWQTSSDQRLNVSMSLAAHTPNEDMLALEQYQPAWASAPRADVYITSPSSVSAGFEMVRRPSDESECQVELGLPWGTFFASNRRRGRERWCWWAGWRNWGQPLELHGEFEWSCGWKRMRRHT